MFRYLVYTLVFCFSLCSVSVAAQSEGDYVPFRWDTRYAYNHPAESPDWTTVQPLSIPYIGVSRLGVSGSEDRHMLYPQEEEGHYRILPHFAGVRFSYDDDGPASLLIYDGQMPSPVFTIRYTAEAGESWQSALGLISTVDSIVTESVFGITEDVKYISTVRVTDNTKFPNIKIAKDLGLLQAFHFADLEYANAPILVAGITNRMVTLGQPFVFPGAIATAQPDDDYYEEKEEAVEGGTRVTQRILRNRDFNRCDPILDAIERLFYKREISFFRPADGSPERDTVVQPPQDEYILINNSSGSDYEHSWVTTPLGTLYGYDIFEDEYIHAIEHVSNDCYTVGMRRSRPLIPVDGPANLLRIDDEPMSTPTFYHSIARPDVDENEGFRLVGINTHRAVCGEQFNFDRLYVSTYDFPDDNRVTLAPNPAVGRTMFSIPPDLGSVKLVVYDAAGRKLRHTTFTGGDRWLETGDLTAGVYTVVVANREGPVARRRLVVR